MQEMSPIVNKLPRLLYQLRVSLSFAFFVSPFLTPYLYICSHTYIKLFFEPFESKMHTSRPFHPIYVGVYF